MNTPSRDPPKKTAEPDSLKALLDSGSDYDYDWITDDILYDTGYEDHVNYVSFPSNLFSPHLFDSLLTYIGFC